MLFFSQTLYGINRGNISEIQHWESRLCVSNLWWSQGEQLSMQTHRVLILLADHICVWYTSFLRLLWQKYYSLSSTNVFSYSSEVRDPKWISLGWNQGVSNTGSPPEFCENICLLVSFRTLNFLDYGLVFVLQS